MEKKFEMFKENETDKLYRIRALRDFGDVKKGDLGGYIEKEENLSHEGNCWVYNHARVFDDAIVYGDARVCDNAKICEEAHIYNNARVYHNATVSGYACVHGSARVYKKTQIGECASIYGNAIVRGNARVFGAARVFDDTWVYDYAIIGGGAIICGGARIYGNAHICDEQVIISGICTTDLSKDIKESIRCQIGLLPVNNKVIAYKRVRKNLTSIYDPSFQYKVGEIAEVIDYDGSSHSCASGLHFTTANYDFYNGSTHISDTCILIAEINLDDIITVQRGKIRCKKAKILDVYRGVDTTQHQPESLDSVT